MTSSQEPPLTRREMRERERLLAQQAESSTPDASAAPVAPATPPAPQQSFPPAQVPQQSFPPAPVPQPASIPQPASMPPVAPTPPQPTPSAAPIPPGYGAPRSGGGYGDQASPFGGAIASPAPPNPFAPRPEPVAPAPPPQAALPEPTTPERTLTRRELRAMLEAHSGEGFDEFELDDAPAAPPTPAPASAAPQQAAPFPQQAASFPQQAAPFPPQAAPTRAPAPHQVAESAFADEPLATPKPVGHWTDQLNAPVERAEPFDQLLSRGGMGHGVPTTTNALILPTLPDHGPMGNSIAPSGEVIVTGSIDLPRSFGATGAHPSQIDSSDVDRLFDQVEDGAGVGAPVSATRAISTQGAARAMMAPPKKEGMNVPLVLAVTAGVLALGVVATLVIGAVSGLF
ncbi:hypothetical protein [Agromyces bauzanensis]